MIPEVPADIYPEYGKDQDFNMIHTNNNLLCAVDVETTGLNFEEHEITEVAILPLNHLLEPNRKYKPFNVIMKPQRLETIQPSALKKSGFKLADLLLTGHDPWRTADALEEWFHRLALPPRHNIMVLAHNWPFDREFLKAWLGPTTFEYIFHPHFRDTMSIGCYLNDRAYDRSDKFFPHPKLSLTALCSQLQIVNKCPHRALYDCVATAEVYKKFVQKMQI